MSIWLKMDLLPNRSSASPERGKLPLRPVSPSRENRRPTSPSLPSVSPTRPSHERLLPSHTRSGSDVQNKVAAFNNLTREAAQRRKDNEAALKRAVLGREEAENDARRLKEENDALRRIAEEGRGRERKVGERLESMMEELQRTKETQTQAQTVYEKEVRRARKEAFKSSSALVQLQEELKTARNRYTLMRVDAEDHKQKLGAKEEELSNAQQELAMIRVEMNASRSLERSPDAGDIPQPTTSSEAVVEDPLAEQAQNSSTNREEMVAAQNELREVSEELFVLQQKLSKAERKIEKAEMQKQVVEEERDALKKSMEEEQIAKSAAQGAIALPPSRDSFGPSSQSENDEFEGLKHEQMSSDGALNEPQDHTEILNLKEELHVERRRRFEAEELAYFSQIECQFGCCSCRRAEQNGTLFINDHTFTATITELSAITGKKEPGRTLAKATMMERPRSQHQARSTTPKISLPQRPRSQQARARQQSPKLFDRPRSQQAGDLRNTPRPYQHSRSVTESAFRTAKELDFQAKRSISHARTSSVTPGPMPPSRQPLQHQSGPSLQERSNRKQDFGNEKVFDIDLSSPWPQPPTTHQKTHPATATLSIQGQPPSPTMDFNFTEIIPNMPSVSCTLPDPSQPTLNQVEDDLFKFEPLKNESTTITVPLKGDTPELLHSPPDLQGGISREEALAQIRARRGRARSYAASHGAPTPKKGITGTPRREISAPSLKRI